MTHEQLELRCIHTPLTQTMDGKYAPKPHTVISDDFESVTTFSVPVSANDLVIASPRYLVRNHDQCRLSGNFGSEI